MKKVNQMHYHVSCTGRARVAATKVYLNVQNNRNLREFVYAKPHKYLSL